MRILRRSGDGLFEQRLDGRDVLGFDERVDEFALLVEHEGRDAADVELFAKSRVGVEVGVPEADALAVSFKELLDERFDAAAVRAPGRAHDEDEGLFRPENRFVEIGFGDVDHHGDLLLKDWVSLSYDKETHFLSKSLGFYGRLRLRKNLFMTAYGKEARREQTDDPKEGALQRHRGRDRADQGGTREKAAVAHGRDGRDRLDAFHLLVARSRRDEDRREVRDAEPHHEEAREDRCGHREEDHDAERRDDHGDPGQENDVRAHLFRHAVAEKARHGHGDHEERVAEGARFLRNARGVAQIDGAPVEHGALRKKDHRTERREDQHRTRNAARAPAARSRAALLLFALDSFVRDARKNRDEHEGEDRHKGGDRHKRRQPRNEAERDETRRHHFADRIGGVQPRHDAALGFLLEVRAVDVDAHLKAAERDAVEKERRALEGVARHEREADEKEAGKKPREADGIAAADSLRERARKRHSDETSDAEAQKERSEEHGREFQPRLHEGDEGRPGGHREAPRKKADARGPKFRLGGGPGLGARVGFVTGNGAGGSGIAKLRRRAGKGLRREIFR